MRETEKAAGVAVQHGLPEETLKGGLQIKNILCPVDFSDFSDVAFRYATTLAWHFHSRVILQHTTMVPKAVLIGGMEPSLVQDAYRAEKANEEHQLRNLAEKVGVGGLEIVRVLSEGDPVANIVAIIESQPVDLVVLGTHGHKGFNRLVLGSVTEQIIHQARCPVLAVSRPRKGGFITPSSPEPLPLRTILLATDFSGSSDRALTYALRWASEWGGRVVLFHAVEAVPPITQGRVDLFPEYNPAFEKQIARAWEKIHVLIPEAAGKTCEVVYEVRHGNPKEEVPRVAEEKNADLIVMGARGAGEAALPWGSTSSAVVREGKFPVLVVRQLRV